MGDTTSSSDPQQFSEVDENQSGSIAQQGSHPWGPFGVLPRPVRRRQYVDLAEVEVARVRSNFLCAVCALLCRLGYGGWLTPWPRAYLASP